MSKILASFMILTAAYSVADDEITFEENEQQTCVEPSCHSSHPPRYQYNPEEERLLEERTEAHWPGKRDDTLLEKLSHY